jgi:hypothetical protein
MLHTNWKPEILDSYCFTFSNKSNPNVLRRQVVQNRWNWRGLLLVYPFKIVSNCILFVYSKMEAAQNHINVINWQWRRHFCELLFLILNCSCSTIASSTYLLCFFCAHIWSTNIYCFSETAQYCHISDVNIKNGLAIILNIIFGQVFDFSNNIFIVCISALHVGVPIQMYRDASQCT